MLIVGGGAALTAIAAYVVWLAVRSLRAAWRRREAEKRARQRADAHRHDAHHSVHSS